MRVVNRDYNAPRCLKDFRSNINCTSICQHQLSISLLVSILPLRNDVCLKSVHCQSIRGCIDTPTLRVYVVTQGWGCSHLDCNQAVSLPLLLVFRIISNISTSFSFQLNEPYAAWSITIYSSSKEHETSKTYNLGGPSLL